MVECGRGARPMMYSPDAMCWPYPNTRRPLGFFVWRVVMPMYPPIAWFAVATGTAVLGTALGSTLLPRDNLNSPPPHAGVLSRVMDNALVDQPAWAQWRTFSRADVGAIRGRTLRASGLRAVDVGGNGDCFFFSVGYAMVNKRVPKERAPQIARDEIGPGLRAAVVHHVRADQARFRESYALMRVAEQADTGNTETWPAEMGQYLDDMLKMRPAGTWRWVDDFMVSATADYLQTPIGIVSLGAGTPSVSIHERSASSRRIILVAYNGRSHYCALTAATS